jgi:hypothetical protein
LGCVPGGCVPFVLRISFGGARFCFKYELVSDRCHLLRQLLVRAVALR